MNKKPWFKKWWGIAIIVFVLFLLLLLLTAPTRDRNREFKESLDQSIEQSKNTQSELQKKINESNSKEVSVKSYQQVFTFSGNGAKKSEPFNITGDRFKISYDCSGDHAGTYCGAFVYKVGSPFPQAVMNSPQATKDSTIIYTNLAGKGEYYIDANVLGNFTMVVEDYK